MPYTQQVEFLLNVVWALVSLALILCWMRSAPLARKNFEWSIVIALLLLIVLLFPAISMTDDLVAVNAPMEVEHMLRRGEAPLTPVTSGGWLDSAAAIIMLCVLSAASLSAYSSRIREHAFPASLTAIFVRAFGVRPPPAPAFLAV